MRKILLAVLAILVIGHGARASMVEATVVFKRGGCRDRFVAKSIGGYMNGMAGRTRVRAIRLWENYIRSVLRISQPNYPNEDACLG